MAAQTLKARREKKCKVCREKYRPRNSLQVVCYSVSCALEWARREERRKARKYKRDGRKRLRTRQDWAKLAQRAFNAWVKERDHDQPCISCGTTGPRPGLKKTGWDAGHYRTVGACPELRFEPLNVHKQCVPCNQHRSGNIVEFRIGLVARIGAEQVAWLEGPHEPKHYTIEDLESICDRYRRMARELKRARNVL